MEDIFDINTESEDEDYVPKPSLDSESDDSLSSNDSASDESVASLDEQRTCSGGEAVASSGENLKDRNLGKQEKGKHRERGSPQSRKRKLNIGEKKKNPRCPNHPKSIGSAFNIFRGSLREELLLENPEVSFKTINQLASSLYKQVDADLLKLFKEEAEKAKKIYDEEMKQYKKTEEYRTYLQSRVKRQKKKKKVEIEEPPPDPMQMEIFSKEFVEFNKATETELRNVRRAATEYEEDNILLSKKIEMLQNELEKAERDSLMQHKHYFILNQYLTKLRTRIVTALKSVNLPGTFCPLEDSNVESVITKLYEYMSSCDDSEILSGVKEALNGVSI